MSAPDQAGPRNREAAGQVPVLIVGGGPVGLTASILLSRQGVRSLLVERHAGTAVHPKARAINARTMELYRQCGVEAAIRAAGLGPEHTGLVVWTTTLSGAEIERRVPWRAGPQSLAHRAEPACRWDAWAVAAPGPPSPGPST
jgi:2-polyprenyl-6-methoxyphenol hydroxylase-like FAD-dependent oxidoreductase